ncbi:hypothetical protein ACFL6U_18850 [Planctomycetota bacterium]
MNLAQLCQFTEGLGKMLNDGIEVKRALDVAGQCMKARANRRFAIRIRETLLTGEDLPVDEFAGSLPPFYPIILKCGTLTGRLPEALSAAAHYIRQVLPVRHTLQRYGKYGFVAYMICFMTTWIFQHRPSFMLLTLFATGYLLPRWFERLAYTRDLILAKTPFIGTWCQQVSLLEFFSCLDICYNSTLSVPAMFSSSIQSVGNRYLRCQLLPSKSAVEQGNSFADAFRAVPFIPCGMVADVEVNEMAGKMELSFSGFARELRKLIEAKLEYVNAQATAFIISYSLFLPAAIILPLFVADEWKEWVAGYFMTLAGYLTLISSYRGFVNYRRKASEVNIWWDTIGNKNH